MRAALPLAVLVWTLSAFAVTAQADRYGDPGNPLNNPATGAADTLQQPGARADNLQPLARPLSQPPAQPPVSNTAPNRSYGEATTVAPPRTLVEAPTEASATPVDSNYAEQMMRAMLSPGPGSQLRGSNIGLADVIRTAGSREEQSQQIGAYWDLCSSVADYYLSLHEQAELERLASRSPALSTPLRAAIVKLGTRRDTSLTAARATQYRLADLMGAGRPSSLPLPGDMPLCVAYHTRYNQNFPSGGQQEAAELHKLLPLRHAELLNAAGAVKESEESFSRFNGQANDAGEVVRALELLALHRRAFVQIARDYNRRITRYTELARPDRLPTGRLVAMLVKNPTGAATANRNSHSAPPTGRSSQVTPPETFRGDWQDPIGKNPPPRLDPEVLPAGANAEEAFVEKVPPGESSVLLRDAGE